MRPIVYSCYYLLTKGTRTATLAKNYVDGMRLNYNNGMFGFVIGLHDMYGIHGDGR